MVKGAYVKLEGSADPEVAVEPTQKRGCVKKALLGVGVVLLIAASIGGAYILKCHQRHHHRHHHGHPPKKVGAGFLFYSEGDVLLLQRNSSHNNATWDVPGGNVEDREDLKEGAEREAQEEMGGWPVSKTRDSILTKRGKHQDKWFTIYIMEADLAAKDFTPKLSNESLAYTWMPLKEALTREDLHPRMLLLFHKREYRRQLAKTLPVSELETPEGEWPEERIQELQQSKGHKKGDCKKGKWNKEGAGLLFSSEGEVLLLLRNSKHNDMTWGLPGGNKEKGDADALATARREATEELGALPEDMDIKADFETTRGKKGNKHYTVYVASISQDARSKWTPELNEEHHEARWFSASEAAALPDLHPVVHQLFTKNEFQTTLNSALGV